jgi:hypothetical protein
MSKYEIKKKLTDKESGTIHLAVDQDTNQIVLLQPIQHDARSKLEDFINQTRNIQNNVQGGKFRFLKMRIQDIDAISTVIYSHESLTDCELLSNFTPDNLEQVIFFSRAIIKIVNILDRRDIIHGNLWPDSFLRLIGTNCVTIVPSFDSMYSGDQKKDTTGAGKYIEKMIDGLITSSTSESMEKLGNICEKVKGSKYERIRELEEAFTVLAWERGIELLELNKGKYGTGFDNLRNIARNFSESHWLVKREPMEVLLDTLAGIGEGWIKYPLKYLYDSLRRLYHERPLEIHLAPKEWEDIENTVSTEDSDILDHLRAVLEETTQRGSRRHDRQEELRNKLKMISDDKDDIPELIRKCGYFKACFKKLKNPELFEQRLLDKKDFELIMTADPKNEAKLRQQYHRDFGRYLDCIISAINKLTISNP